MNLDVSEIFCLQTQVSAKWADPGMAVRKMKKEEWSELKDEFLNSFVPDRTLMSVQLFGEQVRVQ